MTSFSQFIKLGFISLSSLVLTLGAQAHENTPQLQNMAVAAIGAQKAAEDANFQESVALLKEAVRKGYLFSDTNFKLYTFKRERTPTLISSKDNSLDNAALSGRYLEPVVNQAIPNPTTGVCALERSLSVEGDDAFLGATEEIRQQTAMKSESEKKLARDFLTLHEAAHCDIALLDKVFVFPQKPEIEGRVNFYFKYLKSKQENFSFYSLLNENFADAYAALELIKLKGATPEVLTVLNKIALERQDKELYDVQNGKISDHHTHLSLLEVLKPSTVSKLSSLSTAQELRQLALETANLTTRTLMIEHSAYISQSLNPGLMQNTVLEYAISRLMDYNEAKNKIKGTASAQHLALRELEQENRVDILSAPARSPWPPTQITRSQLPLEAVAFLKHKQSFVLKMATQVSNTLIKSGLFDSYEDNQELSLEQREALKNALQKAMTGGDSLALLEVVGYHQTTLDLIHYLNQNKSALSNHTTLDAEFEKNGFLLYTKQNFQQQTTQSLIEQHKLRLSYILKTQTDKKLSQFEEKEDNRISHKISNYRGVSTPSGFKPM